ncbi:hypothetical protein BU14_0582s0011 [Porphyra umbilicalis]|uniref:Methyltransferase type 11 domain-containing protein n=1 Tax=Porphyra umbilicalis TaxID=2786 RepID=A0A1X6NRG6_PORUM|nr:hypothetical protein BU14_0582s0011 [Porphyra umbilicalis]|eukprot:OSX71175.1 hypothetical protein BU14_0582s0011 [Porphyra umbilicalis]
MTPSLRRELPPAPPPPPPPRPPPIPRTVAEAVAAVAPSTPTSAAYTTAAAVRVGFFGASRVAAAASVAAATRRSPAAVLGGLFGGTGSVPQAAARAWLAASIAGLLATEQANLGARVYPPPPLTTRRPAAAACALSSGSCRSTPGPPPAAPPPPPPPPPTSLRVGRAAAVGRRPPAAHPQRADGPRRGVVRLGAAAHPASPIVNVDLSPFYLAKAHAQFAASAAARSSSRAGGRVFFVRAAAEALPLPDASMDVVLSVFLLHELPPHVRAGVFAEWARVLAPGGLLVVVDSVQAAEVAAGGLPFDPAGFAKAYHEPFYDTYQSTDF